MSDVKLTKEQADYVLKQFKFNAEQFSPNSDYVQAIGITLQKRLQATLHQCIDWPFPEIAMCPKHAEDKEEIRVYELNCQNAGTKCIILYSFEEFTHFNHQQFKEFVLKCNKIIEWIDNQTSDKEGYRRDE